MDAAARQRLPAQHRDQLPRHGDRHRARHAARARRRSRCCRPVRGFSWVDDAVLPQRAVARAAVLLHAAAAVRDARSAQSIVPLPDWLKATFGLSLPVMANVSEIVRGAVQSIPYGQWESAESLAFSRRQTLWMIILPQCVKRMLPPWMNLYAILASATALASIVGVNEAMTLTGDVLAAESRTELLRADVSLPAALVLRSIATRSPARPSRSSAASRCADDADAVDARPAAGAHRRRAQGVRRRHRAQGRLARRDEGRGDLHHRPVGLGQVDASALHQRPGADRARLDPGRGPGGQRSEARQARAAPQGRHGVPAIQPVPAQDRAARTS